MTVFLAVRISQAHYRAIFVGAYGPFPHPCYFGCRERIVKGYTRPWDGGAAVIHHIDGDQDNNEPENLAPCHHGCHVVYHHTGVKRPPEVGRRITEALTGRKLTEKHKENIGAGRKGQKHTEEAKASISAAMQRLAASPEWRANVSAGLTGRKREPFSVEARANMGAAQIGRKHSPESVAQGAAKRKGQKRSAETRERMRKAKENYPEASCIKCHRTMSMIGMPNHLRACRPEPPQ